ncbi:PTS cellobiose transporter subunit IIC [Dolosigranulum pigrum]|uniref:PTS sugar transporter subunit IIC n=1 Tax=Dolosigranulum pigrum TaxID=29394 RepID=UPI000DBF614B|nr:PTS transporter subunit EIIC [Dolosigranulum pigrum]RAN55524.1 PTS cellobiose transporter subunit IIC [Dolosigranulum pigrum]
MMSSNNFVENKLAPIAAIMSQNKGLVAVRDGITLAMPLIIIGSIFMIIASFPFPVWWEEWLGEIGVADYLWKGVSSSFGLIGLVASFGIPYSLCKQYKVDGVAGGIVSLSSFIVVTPFVSGEDGAAGITTEYMGATGLFVSIILGLLSGYLYVFCIKKNIQIKMPDSVPPAVARSFSAIIPGAIIISSWLVIFGLLDSLGLPDLHNLAGTILGGPLGLLGGNVIGTIIVATLNSLFWFVGLHGGNTVNQIMQPIWLANLDENIAAYQAGEVMENIITTPFMDNFVYLGGGGATIGLVVVIAYLARKKNASQQTKTIAPLTLVPGFFNINEPAMFGIPVVLNFVLLVPFLLAPAANVIISYLAMSSGLVPLTRVATAWTMPPIISGFLTTGSIRGSILQIVLIIVDILIYVGFYLSVEKKLKEEETV